MNADEAFQKLRAELGKSWLVDREKLTAMTLRASRAATCGAFELTFTSASRTTVGVDEPLPDIPLPPSTPAEPWGHGWPPANPAAAGTLNIDVRQSYDVLDCPRCRAAGRMPCPACHGSGRAADPQRAGRTIPCATCRTSGVMQCPSCAARGRLIRFTRIQQQAQVERRARVWRIGAMELPTTAPSGRLSLQLPCGVGSKDEAARVLSREAPRFQAEWSDELIAEMLNFPRAAAHARPSWFAVEGRWFDGWELECACQGTTAKFFVSENSVTGPRLRSTRKVLGVVGAGCAALVLTFGALSWSASVARAKEVAAAEARAEQKRLEHEKQQQALLAAVPAARDEVEAILTATAADALEKIPQEQQQLDRAQASLARFEHLDRPPTELVALKARLATAVALNARRVTVVDALRQSKEAEAEGDAKKQAKDVIAADDAYSKALTFLKLDPDDVGPMKVDDATRRAEVTRKVKAIAGSVAAERARRAAEEKATREREAKAAAKAAAEQKEAEVLATVCGTKPVRSAWDGEVYGVARALKNVAHDPDSINVKNCTEPELSEKHCWITTCQVRGKNAFGALILNAKRFSISNLGVEEF